MDWEKFNQETREMFINTKDHTGWYFAISMLIGICIGLAIGYNICEEIISVWLIK